MHPSFRARASFSALALGTVALGLFVQHARGLLPSALGDMLGDALWAMLITWLAGAGMPSLPSSRRATGALLFSWAVELGQLYHAPWIDGWRATTLGHLMLGADFDPRDLAAYAFGVLIAFGLEQALFPSISAAASAPRGST